MILNCYGAQAAQKEEAVQLLVRCFTQQPSQDGSEAFGVESLKMLLRLMISYEGRHLGAGFAVENPNHASVAAAAARRVDLGRYKTELCRSYAEMGHCRYGLKCQFAHGADELRPLARHPRYRTELCHSFHVTGFCPYGSRCNFIHSDATAPPGIPEVSTNGTLAQMPAVMQRAALPLHSPGSFQALEQFLKHSNDVGQRAICGRPVAAEMCPMAVLQALGSWQATAHMKRMQDR